MSQSNSDDNTIRTIGIIFLIIIGISALVEAGVLVYAYVNADKVDCNFLWCTFKTERSTTTTTSSQTCYENGVQINCSAKEWKWANDDSIHEVIKVAIK